MNTRRRRPAVALAVSILLLGGMSVARAHAPSHATVQPLSAASAPRAAQGYGRMPLWFFEDPYVPPGTGYLVQGRDATIRFAPHGFTLHLASVAPSRPHGSSEGPGQRPFYDGVATRSGGARPTSRVHRLQLAFVAAEPDVEVAGDGLAPGRVSYFRGSPEQWRTGIKTYRELRYRNVWPGVDLAVSGVPGRLAFSFLVRPGADPSRIRVAAHGATGLAVTEAGELGVRTPIGDVRVARPVAYQEVRGRREAVGSSFTVGRGGSPAGASGASDAATYGFEVAGYDRSRPLVVESAFFVYAGFIGGPRDDRALGIDVDAAGAAYVTGQTPSPATGWLDAYVVKVRPDGTGFEYFALIGGERNDEGFDLVVDSQGSAYVTGATESFHGTFPVTVGPDLTFNGTIDAFVCKLTPRGTRLVFCGYLGGNLIDFGEGIAVDADRNVYVEGPVQSTHASFPAKVGPDVTFNGFFDAFVAKVRAFPNAPNVKDNLFFAGYIGGSSSDIGLVEGFITSGHIAVDAEGQMYVSGETLSTEATFPDGDGFGTLPGPDRTHNGDWDAWVAKVAANGSTLLYAGYIGGMALDFGFGMAVDAEGSAYLTGNTESSEATFPVTVGPDLTHNGLNDGFVAKVNPLGTGLVYAGYIGGDGDDQGLGLTVEPDGHLYVIGVTASAQATFPVVGGPDLTFNGQVDAYLAKVKPNPAEPIVRNNFVFNGYIGGSGDDAAFWVALDSAGAAYVVGDTDSTEATFPDGDGFGSIPGPDQTANGGVDGFIVKIVV